MRFIALLAAALVLYGLLPLPWWAYVPANLALAAALIATARARGHSFHDLGLHPTTWRRGLAIGGAAALVVLIAVGLGTVIGSQDPETSQMIASQADLGPLGLAWELLVRLPLGTVLVEAVIFRGVLFAEVKRAHSTLGAVIVTSVVFGLWHIGPTLRDLRELGAAVDPIAAVASIVLITTLGGVLFAALRLAGRSLVASALTHWSMNAAGIVAALWLATT
jgi:uncharacterized protein